MSLHASIVGVMQARAGDRINPSDRTTDCFAADSETLLFSSNDELWWFQPGKGSPVMVDPKKSSDAGPCMDPKFCPADPDLVSFVRDNSLWVSRVSSGVTWELAVADKSTVSIAMPSYIIQEEFSRYSGYWWRESRSTAETYSIL